MKAFQYSRISRGEMQRVMTAIVPGVSASQPAAAARNGAASSTQHPACAPRSSSIAKQSAPAPSRLRTIARQSSTLNGDYKPAPGDEGVLTMPPKLELKPYEIRNVFGYPRDLQDRYILGKVIGAGSFGVVREARCVSNNMKYALKTISKIPKRGPPTPRYLLKLRTEIEVMEQLGASLDAVSLKDVFEDDGAVHLVMELCTGGALLERAMDHSAYSERYIAKIVCSIVRFISQCHAKGIVYRDIKPDNFLFLNTHEHSPLKATDFGLSIRHNPGDPKMTSRSGTPAYMAPELVSQWYDEKCDVWSIGMLTYQLLTGRFPYWENVRNASLNDVWRSILTEEINWSAAELRPLSPGALDILKLMLRREPEDRPSASDLLEHPWLREHSAEASSLPLKGSVVQRLQRFATYTHLKQVVLRIIADEIQASHQFEAIKTLQDTSLEELFKKLDVDSSGAITLDELTHGLKSQGYVISKAEVATLMSRIDVDHSGKIEYGEFVATLIDWNEVASSDSHWMDYLEHAFARLDTDGDGFISSDELIDRLPPSYFDVHGGERSNAAERLAEAQKMLREADVNGDGRISREEFFRLLSGPGMGMHDSLSMYDNRLDTTLSSQDEYAEDFNGTGAVPPAKEQTLSGQRK